MKQSLIIIIFFLQLTKLVAQEIIVPLHDNPMLKNTVSERSATLKSLPQLLMIPFNDDFSDAAHFPDQILWSDSDVFVNQNFPKFPPTLGVATFDVLDQFGEIYHAATANIFIADYLTSRPLRLDSTLVGAQMHRLTPADSIILSFYYQPGGHGFAPDPSDSLVVEFYLDHYVDSLKRWVRVWSASGQQLEPFREQHGNYFGYAEIRITDTAFMKPGFRFRFFNYASIRIPAAPSRQSNRDFWHIDDVYINRNRTSGDRSRLDVAFVNQPGSLLKNFYAMPYRQYKQNSVNEMGFNLQVLISNRSNINQPSSYRYEVRNAAGALISKHETPVLSFLPYHTSGYVNQPEVAQPPVNLIFPSYNQPSASFFVEHIITHHGTLTPDRNDTVRFVQTFSNEFAYDDGSAEAGYGLNFQGGMLAYRFRLNTPDTLTAIRMFFNRTINNASQQFFRLKVWNEFGGRPGQLIYSQENLRPQYHEGLNVFHEYQIEQPVFIENNSFPGLVFYIGWEQFTDDLLNIGFDHNTNSSGNILYLLSGQWYNTMFEGSLMMRPVFGTLLLGTDQPPEPQKLMVIYPNPVSGNYINLKI
ncbi:MAG TPA: hypothetical protein VLH16_00845, partial [Bacteroidales bacterium]|nr:hypothetical protein [Bacteroidales bacterium]